MVQPIMLNDDLTALEARRYAAMLTNDAGALERLLSEDAVYVHSSGARDSKDEYLARISSGGLVYLSVEHSEELCVLSGSTGIVLGEMAAEVVLNGSRLSIENKHLAVWAGGEDGWRLLAYYSRPTA